jgi:FMN phosphatase YigB (HAD superfamily)
MAAKNIRKAKRQLLLTFDAFSTLFHPRTPVPEQYCQVAYSYGLSSDVVTPEKVGQAFKESFKAQSKKFPNYGRNEVLKGRYSGPKQWWGDVIQDSFAKVMSTSPLNGPRDLAKLPDGMVDRLLDVFASQEGYSLYGDVMPLFKKLKEWKDRINRTHTATGDSEHNFTHLVVGVISNSDDRVPAILKSLGLKIGDIRADCDPSRVDLPGFEEGGDEDSRPEHFESEQCLNDIDMIITSYEAGEEKPHRLIFDVAKKQAQTILRSQTTSLNIAEFDSSNDWLCLHVGDDYSKDCEGAANAGWDTVLVLREHSSNDDNFKSMDIRSIRVIHSLDDLMPNIENYIQS